MHSSLWADLWSLFLLDAGVKEILFQRCRLESYTLPGTKRISILVVFYELSSDTFALCLKGRTAVGWSHPNTCGQNIAVGLRGGEDQDHPSGSPGLPTIFVPRDETFRERSWFKEDATVKI